MSNRQIAMVAFVTVILGVRFTGRAESDFETAPNPLNEPVVFPQEPEGLSPEIAKLVRAVAEAKTAKDARVASDKLFQGADRKKLERLKQVTEDGVALRAAWHEIVLSGTPRTKKDWEFGPLKLVSKAAGARFLGFIEGRLKTTVPKWWEACATEAYRFDENGVLRAGKPNKLFGVGEEKLLYITSGISQSVADGRITLRRGDDEVRLTPEVVETYLRRHQQLSALVEPEMVLLAPHDYHGASYPLVCIDRAAGKKKWEARVWSWALDRGSSGPSYEFVSLVATGDRVLVFGVVSSCCYLEGFDRKTGRNLFRFANEYAQ